MELPYIVAYCGLEYVTVTRPLGMLHVGDRRQEERLLDSRTGKEAKKDARRGFLCAVNIFHQ